MTIGEDTWVNFLTALTALIWSAWQQIKINKIEKHNKEKVK